MELDFKKLLYAILILIIGYILTWLLTYLFYEIFFKVFPVFDFMASLAVNLIITSVLFFIIIRYNYHFKKISKKDKNILITIILFSITFIVLFFKDFWKYW